VGRDFASADQIDRPGVKVGTSQNSPSDRFLTRTLKSAQLVRLPLSPNFPADAIEMLRSGKADVFGADSGLIDSIARGYPGAKTVPGAFHTVRVAIALPKGRLPAAQAKLAEIVGEAKRTGIVQKAIEQSAFAAAFALRQIDRSGSDSVLRRCPPHDRFDPRSGLSRITCDVEVPGRRH
jgi:polar amino acid transport system substrate-binding protein